MGAHSASIESVWENLYISGAEEPVAAPAPLDWFATRAYAELRRWITPGDKMILDAGFGTGRLCMALARDLQESVIHGIDISPALVEAARERAAGHGFGNVRFEEQDIFDLRFEDASFDAVFNQGVIEHFSDYQGALREMVRVTKPSGKVIVTVPNWYCFPHTFRKWVLKRLGVPFEYGFEKSFRPAELGSLLTEVGLQAVELSGYGFMQSVNRLLWHTRAGALIRRIGGLHVPLEALGRCIEDRLISLIDRCCARAFSRTFGFEIVAKGVRM